MKVDIWNEGPHQYRIWTEQGEVVAEYNLFGAIGMVASRPFNAHGWRRLTRSFASESEAEDFILRMFKGTCLSYPHGRTA